VVSEELIIGSRGPVFRVGECRILAGEIDVRGRCFPDGLATAAGRICQAAHPRWGRQEAGLDRHVGDRLLAQSRAPVHLGLRPNSSGELSGQQGHPYPDRGPLDICRRSGRWFRK
jgi:hypothetical protein